MHTAHDKQLLGFVDLDLGRSTVRVPIHRVDPMAETGTSASLVSLEYQGIGCEILVRGDASSEEVSRGVEEAAKLALRHLSTKLLS